MDYYLIKYTEVTKGDFDCVKERDSGRATIIQAGNPIIAWEKLKEGRKLDCNYFVLEDIHKI